MDIVYRIIETVFPFDWAKYAFMKNALLAVCLSAPLFAVCGTAVVNSRMVFFSDVLGHSALTGIALGVVLGMQDPMPVMIVFAVMLAVAVNVVKRFTGTASDTILGVFFAAVVALGVVLLSRGGNFSKFTSYLIGDILAVTVGDLYLLLGLIILVGVYWVCAANDLLLVSINGSFARSRGVAVFLTETVFTAVLAVVVICSIRLVGLLIINALLILPAACARTISTNMRSYTWWAVGISVVCGIAGLIGSFYWNTASGATIVLFLAAWYMGSVIAGLVRKRIYS